MSKTIQKIFVNLTQKMKIYGPYVLFSFIAIALVYLLAQQMGLVENDAQDDEDDEDGSLKVSMNCAQMAAHGMFCAKKIPPEGLKCLFYGFQIPNEYYQCLEKKGVDNSKNRFECAKEHWTKFSNHEKFKEVWKKPC